MKKALVYMFAPLLLSFSMAFGSDPTLVVIDNKLVKVESVVEPKIKITSPSGPVDLGEIVILQADVTGDVPTFVKKKSYKWNVTEKGYVKQFWMDGQKVVFGSGVKATTIKVSLQVQLTYEVGKEEVVKTIEQAVDVSVGGVLPPDPTPPGPGPGPAPTPTPAPDVTGFAKDVRDMFVATPLPGVDQATKVKAAGILAKVYRDTAPRLGHDAEVASPRELLSYIHKANNAALTKEGLDPLKFDPFWDVLQVPVYKMYSDKILKTAFDYTPVFNQIADGLAAVK
jgi:hypothetical protein